MSIFFRRCLFSHFQETHLESIGENEFLFAKGEFDVDKLFVLVDFTTSPNYLVIALISCCVCLKTDFTEVFRTYDRVSLLLSQFFSGKDIFFRDNTNSQFGTKFIKYGTFFRYFVPNNY